MIKTQIQELREQNRKSASGIAFLIAGIIALTVYGFWQASLPAFLLAAVFTVLSVMESREYKKSCSIELQITKTMEHEKIS